MAARTFFVPPIVCRECRVRSETYGSIHLYKWDKGLEIYPLCQNCYYLALWETAHLHPEFQAITSHLDRVVAIENYILARRIPRSKYFKFR